MQIPEPGRRERLGLKMANEAAAKNRAKKQEALRKVTENLARWGRCALVHIQYTFTANDKTWYLVELVYQPW